MKTFYFLGIMITLMACSHHHNKVTHHHHKYDKLCAYEVSQNHLDVSGQEEFSLDHEGKTYYFSTQEKKDLFKKDLDRNIQNSNKIWKARGVRKS